MTRLLEALGGFESVQAGEPESGNYWQTFESGVIFDHRPTDAEMAEQRAQVTELQTALVEATLNRGIAYPGDPEAGEPSMMGGLDGRPPSGLRLVKPAGSPTWVETELEQRPDGWMFRRKGVFSLAQKESA